MAALDHSEQEGPAGGVSGAAAELGQAADRPAEGVFHAGVLFLGRSIRVGTVVEADHDVGVELELVGDAFFGCQPLSDLGAGVGIAHSVL